jgi:hypothetical protein
MPKALSRDIVTPSTAVLFLVSTVTGLMLFVRWQSGLVHSAHEWLSIAFSALAIWHVSRNWRAMLTYFRRGPAMAALAACLALSLIFTAATGSTSTGGGPRVVFEALGKATLVTAAPVFGLEPDAAIALLADAGIVGAMPTATLASIGAEAGRSTGDVIATLATAGR